MKKVNPDTFRKFTLQQANELLPELNRITRQTIKKLEAERTRRETEIVKCGHSAEAEFQQKMNVLLQRWAQQVIELGVMPKGYFTCDFVSPNPERLFCWNYGEKQIGYTHKKTESFKDRVPLKYPELQGFEVSLN